MDKFECWTASGNRLGLIYVDYATQKRTPTGSASFYREVIARNAGV